MSPGSVSARNVCASGQSEWGRSCARARPRARGFSGPKSPGVADNAGKALSCIKRLSKRLARSLNLKCRCVVIVFFGVVFPAARGNLSIVRAPIQGRRARLVPYPDAAIVRTNRAVYESSAHDWSEWLIWACKRSSRGVLFPVPCPR